MHTHRYTGSIVFATLIGTVVGCADADTMAGSSEWEQSASHADWLDSTEFARSIADGEYEPPASEPITSASVFLLSVETGFGPGTRHIIEEYNATSGVLIRTVTSYEDEGTGFDERFRLMFNSHNDLIMSGRYEHRCFDLETGEVLWTAPLLGSSPLFPVPDVKAAILEGDRLVSMGVNASVLEFDATNGSFLGTLVPGLGGVSDVIGLAEAPDLSLLRVYANAPLFFPVEQQGVFVQRLDASSGELIDVPLSINGAYAAFEAELSADERLAVQMSDWGSSETRIEVYDIDGATHLSTVVPSDLFALPSVMAFGKGSELFVCSQLDVYGRSVAVKFDIPTGKIIQRFARASDDMVFRGIVYKAWD